MKNVITLVCLAGLFLSANLYGQNLPKVDKSPLDVSYMPHNYAHDGGEELVARVFYSRPAKKDREVFGKLVPYGKVWRIGANEAVEIEFYKDVKLGGKELKAGAYSLFAIPGKDSWVIIISNMRHTWGAYSYKEKTDVLRVEVPVSVNNEVVENLTLMFAKKGKKESLNIYWDQTLVEVPIEH